MSIQKHFLIYILLCTINVQAQDTLYTYFNKGYGIVQTNRLYHCVIPLIEGGFVNSAVIGGVDNYRALGVTFTNQLGEVELSSILYAEENKAPVLTLGSSMIELKDGNFAVTVSVLDYPYTSNGSNCHIFKFDGLGNVLWQYEYEHPWNEAGLTLTEGADGDLLVAGWQQDDTNPTDILLIKLNAQGEQEWVRAYSAPDDCYAGAFSANAYPNGSFLISGAVNYGDSCQEEFKRYLMKIDEDGEMIWEREYPGSVYVAKSALLEDESIIFSSASEASNGDADRLYIAHLDATGEPLVEKEYTIEGCGTIQSEVRVLEDGYIGIAWSIRMMNGVEKRRPLIIRFNEELDTLWTKTITYTDEYNMISRDLEKTADGGFIIAGFQLSGAFQIGWLAKVDSLGHTCGGFVEDCDSIVYSIPDGTEHLISRDKIRFSISPNPVRDIAYLQYDLPTVLPYAWLHIYDTNGVERRSKRLMTSEISSELDLPHLKDGIYIYVLRIGDRVLLEGKLVVG